MEVSRPDRRPAHRRASSCLLGGAFVAVLGSVAIGLVAGRASRSSRLASRCSRGLVLAIRGARTLRDASRRRILGTADPRPSLRRRRGRRGRSGARSVGAEACVRPRPAAVQDATAARPRRGVHGAGPARASIPGAPATCSCCSRRSTARTTRRNRSAACRAIRARATRAVWMYLERIPLVAYGPGCDRGRHRGAGLARRPGADDRAADRFRRLARATATGGRCPARAPPALTRPKVVVTFVFDGGGWNVLAPWPDDWPHLGALMREGANYRNAITGSFPAVTACAHATIGTGTFPQQARHHRPQHPRRRRASRKAYGTPGRRDPTDILAPDARRPLARRRRGPGSARSAIRSGTSACSGHGGRDRPADDLPVGVYWDEDGAASVAAAQPRAVPPCRRRRRSRRPHGATWRRSPTPRWDPQFAPVGATVRRAAGRRSSRYQGDLIEAAFDSRADRRERRDRACSTRPSSRPTTPATSTAWRRSGTGLRCCARSTRSSGDSSTMLEDAVPRRVRVDRDGRPRPVPAPRLVGGVRLDPIQLEQLIEPRFGGTRRPCRERRAVGGVPERRRAVGRRRRDDRATSPRRSRDYRYRQNIGPYVPRSAIEQDLLDQKEFAAVFGTTFLESLADERPHALR